MRHAIASPVEILTRSLLHAAAEALGAAVVRNELQKGALTVHLARGEHVVAVEVRSGRVGGLRWEVTALRGGAAAELSVRPELAGEGFDKLLGMTLDLPTGDAAFDERFVIEAAPAAVASHLLGGDLRACLMALPRSDDGPALRITADALSLRWAGDFDRDLAVHLLRAVFDCLERCRALHDAMLASAAQAPFRASSGGAAAVDPGSRAEARARIGRARRKAAAFIATTAVAAAAFLASAITVGR
ncbi:MAG: hypothetical protein U0325_18510 [Polyangiales bacterium]